MLQREEFYRCKCGNPWLETREFKLLAKDNLRIMIRVSNVVVCPRCGRVIDGDPILIAQLRESGALPEEELE